MSKMSDILIGFQEEFDAAHDEYNFLTEELERNGYNVEVAISAAMYYGKMVGIAEMTNALVDPSPLMNELIWVKPKLRRKDYKKRA